MKSSLTKPPYDKIHDLYARNEKYDAPSPRHRRRRRFKKARPLFPVFSGLSSEFESLRERARGRTREASTARVPPSSRRIRVAQSLFKASLAGA